MQTGGSGRNDLRHYESNDGKSLSYVHIPSVTLEKGGDNRYMSFAIFLDVDGVLNTRRTVISSPDGHIGVDGARIKILAGAIKKYGGGDIVLTSDWKNVKIGDDLDYLREELMEHGLEISAVTKEYWNKRGQGVQDYLEEHPWIDEYIILDDNRFDFEDFPRLWERLLITDGIENAAFASKTPAVETIIFQEYIKELS